jgi:hypothetical protein
VNLRLRLFLVGLFVTGGLSWLTFFLIQRAIASDVIVNWVLASLAIPVLGLTLTRFKTVRLGNRGIIEHLTLGGAFAEVEVTPGLCWIPPKVAKLNTYPCEPRTWTLPEFLVESGSRLDFTVCVSIGWHITENGLAHYGSAGPLTGAIEAHIKGTTKALLSRVGAEDDRGEVRSRLQDLIRESLTKRCQGIETRLSNGDWKTARLEPIESVSRPWGLAISDVQIIRLDSPSDLKGAASEATAGTIRSAALPQTTEKIAGAIGALGDVGIEGEISAQIVQSQIGKQPLRLRDYYLVPPGQNLNVGYARNVTPPTGSHVIEDSKETRSPSKPPPDTTEGESQSS